MARFRATLAYDGSDYNGFQIQLGLPTIQGEVERALADLFGQPTRIIGAGRTDTGVHATGQVIAFDADWHHDDAALLQAINARLSRSIALQDIVRQPGFHPRYDALSRTYRYDVAVCHVRQPLLNQRAWQVHTAPDEIDLDAMNTAAGLLIGEHDFAAFGKPPHGVNTVRHVFRSTWAAAAQPYGLLLSYTVEATAFLYNMVRRFVGTLMNVGRGRLTVDEFEAIFHSGKLENAKQLAPPHGLVLVRVTYPPFTIDHAADSEPQAVPVGMRDRRPTPPEEREL